MGISREIEMPQNNEGLNEVVKNNYEFWGLFIRINKLIAKARDIELAKYGITREQSHILHILHSKGGSSTLNELATLGLVNHNATSTLVIRMEKLGLVERIKTPDSRHFQINMTEKGRAVFEGMPRASVEMIFSELTLNEKKMIAPCLLKLEKRTRELLGMDYKPPFVDEP
jgi:DNA-binding MarR family transcriptional regulator